MLKIEEFATKPVSPPAGGGKVEPPKPAIKPRKTIKPATLVEKTYLETLDDVDDFIRRLRAEMEEAVKQGQRIQIQ